MGIELLHKQILSVGSSLASLAKVALLSRRAFDKGDETGTSLVIMGNGPSLRQTLAEEKPWLESHDLMGVNFAANTPEYFELKPENYTLADGHFFTGMPTDPNVAKLWEALKSTDWPMTLFVPWKYAREAWRLTSGHPTITVKAFNLTPVEGSEWLAHRLMDGGWGMPRPRNVMIPAIMNAIRAGYRTIYLVGADHTWTKTLDVDDENYVVSVQPHFYDDNKDELERVRSAYAGLHLHDVLGSMTVAFRSYWQIAAYAAKRGVKIINATPRSMIDAFPRK